MSRTPPSTLRATLLTVALLLAFACAAVPPPVRGGAGVHTEDAGRGDAGAPDDAELGDAAVADDNDVHLLEITFGQSQLFFRQNATGQVGFTLLPTSSALFLSEFILHRDFAIAGFFNLPLGTERIIENGVVREVPIGAAAAAGI
ncbi:MAG: hypothetical protein ACK4N5_12240, partial [Myxococcales bacterium]